MSRPDAVLARTASRHTALKPLVLLHGLMGAAANWAETQQYFSGRYRLLPVHFPLYEPDSPYHSVRSLTQYVCEEMDRREVQKAVIFGNSMGGQIALNIAVEAPHRVAGLVLTGSAGLLERNIGEAAPLNPNREYVWERARECFYDERWVTNDLVDDLQRILSSNRNKLRLVKLARSLRQYNMHDHLPEIAAPTLLIWGREDTLTPLSVAEIFAERLPNARLRVLERCGHAPNIEQAEAFNRLTEEFLEEIGYV